MNVRIKDRIGTPVESRLVHSEAELRQNAAGFLVRLGLSPVLRQTAEHPRAYASGGWWVVMCPCGNAADAHPGDGTDNWPEPVAICFECGSLFRPVFPADRLEIEHALLARSNQRHRNFWPRDTVRRHDGSLHPGETLADIRRENSDHGVGR